MRVLVPLYLAAIPLCLLKYYENPRNADLFVKKVLEVIVDIDRLIDQLGQADPDWQIAAEALHRKGGSTEVRNRVIKEIESDNYLLRMRSIDLLGRGGDIDAVEPLKRASKISKKDFIKFAGRHGSTISVKYPGGEVELQMEEAWKEYRKKSKGAVKAIKKIRKDAKDDVKALLHR